MKLETFELFFSKINKYSAKKCQTLVVNKCITKKKEALKCLKLSIVSIVTLDGTGKLSRFFACKGELN
jgi:hypothetical protein